MFTTRTTILSTLVLGTATRRRQREDHTVTVDETNLEVSAACIAELKSGMT
jgi:hypothetical protein